MGSKIWKMLDGSKTAIGNTLLIVGSNLKDGWPKTLIFVAGSLLTGVGLSNKFIKAKQN